jgi:hypothetical protein
MLMTVGRMPLLRVMTEIEGYEQYCRSPARQENSPE